MNPSFSPQAVHHSDREFEALCHEVRIVKYLVVTHMNCAW
jgi:hypothetical protein